MTDWDTIDGALAAIEADATEADGWQHLLPRQFDLTPEQALQLISRLTAAHIHTLDPDDHSPEQLVGVIGRGIVTGMLLARKLDQAELVP